MRAKAKPPQAAVATCGECAFSSWDTKEINLTAYDRKPFMLKCPFTPWKRFPKDAACDRFKLKTN